MSVRRREFISFVGGLVVWNAAARAQRSSRLHRVGMLERTSVAINASNLEGFREGLRDLGHSDSGSYIIEYRSADGIDELFPELAAELVRLNVDVILTRGTPAALAAKNATATIPVIMVGIGDPVGQGLVDSLARPGGNVTGLSALVTDLYAKRVQLLREIVPGARRIAALFNMSNLAIPPQWREVENDCTIIGYAAPASRCAESLELFGAGVRCCHRTRCRHADRRPRDTHTGQPASYC